MSPRSPTRRGFAGIIGAAAALWRGKAIAEPGATFDVTLTSDVKVRMRDGVRLATDIYRPAKDGRAVAGRFPVILERTPIRQDRRQPVGAVGDGPRRRSPAPRWRASSSRAAMW